MLFVYPVYIGNANINFIFTRPAMNASGMGVDSPHLTSSCLADNVGGSDGILGGGMSGTCQSS